MLILMFGMMPALCRTGVVSIHDDPGSRFGLSTHLLISADFQLSRSFGTGIVIHATELILNSVMGIAFLAVILLIGLMTAAHAMLGGMKTVVYSDLLQMMLILAGAAVIALAALSHLGGWDGFLTRLDTGRLQMLRTDPPGSAGDEWGLAP